MAKIITLGEIMLRLSTKTNQRIVQVGEFVSHYGGGEANVAVSLSNYGHDAYFVTKLPNNEVGDAALNSVRKFGVHTDYIVRGGARVGIYFLETGVSMRPSKVIYDRAHSSISEATRKDFNFDKIFKNADWFHFSGITPALSKTMVDVTIKACQVAKKHGIPISCDLNYRKKLWTSEQAQKVMRPLMEYVDVCIGNEEDAELCLGFRPKGVDVHKGKLDIGGYKEIFKQMKDEFGFKVIATTLRESHSANHNTWSALLYDGIEFFESKKYDINPILDRVGGGDAFSGGLIHGLLTKGKQEALEFAVAASALKHTILGDANQVSIDEVENLINGDSSGRVQR